MEISILVPHKLRSRVELENGGTLELFPKMIQSLRDSVRELDDFKFELVVSDFDSSDYPLSQWLDEESAGMPVNVIDCQGITFDRGTGLNTAADYAQYDVFCLMDTDMLLGKPFWIEAKRAIVNNMAFFPICWSYKDPKHTEGWWRETGFGMSVVTRDWYYNAGKVEEMGKWGKEDNIFVHRISQIVQIYRPRLKNYYHQWHPNDFRWKNKHVGKK